MSIGYYSQSGKEWTRRLTRSGGFGVSCLDDLPVLAIVVVQRLLPLEKEFGFKLSQPALVG